MLFRSPMITDRLDIAVSAVGQRAAVLGAAREALDLAFSPDLLTARGGRGGAVSLA